LPIADWKAPLAFHSAIGNRQFANDYFPQHGGQHSSHSGGQQPPHRFRIPVTALSNAHIMGPPAKEIVRARTRPGDDHRTPARRRAPP
jgi:hypothetical protein